MSRFKIRKEDVIAKCSDLMLEGAYIEAIEALEYANDKGVEVEEDEVRELYELKVKINYELI